MRALSSLPVCLFFLFAVQEEPASLPGVQPPRRHRLRGGGGARGGRGGVGAARVPLRHRLLQVRECAPPQGHDGGDLARAPETCHRLSCSPPPTPSFSINILHLLSPLASFFLLLLLSYLLFYSSCSPPPPPSFSLISFTSSTPSPIFSPPPLLLPALLLLLLLLHLIFNLQELRLY